MTDNPKGSAAWKLDPATYFDSRVPTHSVPVPKSLYLEMPDGVRLAVDVYVPEGDAPENGFPTILHLTPYYRRFAVKPGAPPETEACPNAAKFRDTFIPRGYAMVVVDVRGTGASFGSRDSFRSPKERDDYRAVIDWVVAQDWSDGTLGATGISYVGAAADFAATTGHPGLKAIAPISAVWDTYLDHYYPGGLLLTNLAGAYDELMQALDLDQREAMRRYVYFADPNLEGPAPVDGDGNRGLLSEAISEHAANVSIVDFIREFPYRDSTLPYDPAFSSGSFSPRAYMDNMSKDLAVFSISGWMDGGYMNGAVSRFLTLGGSRRHLLLGPWDHGARIQVSPFRSQEEPEFPLHGAILRFFDEYVRGEKTGLADEAPVHYYTMAEEAWKDAADWPPTSGEGLTLHLTQNRDLTTEKAESGSVSCKPDFGFGTGSNTRYGRLQARDVRNYYASWQARSEELPRFVSDPLDEGICVSGHPVVSLLFETDEADAAVIAYLEDIAPDGTRRYVTEGLLRALHRKEVSPPADYQANWPFHSCEQADAAAMTPGEPESIRFALLATSWEFAPGHRIGLALAGADKDNVVRIPYGRPGNWKIHVGGDAASFLELPVE
ncbi:MAG: CocE/NonD family hydrolase [Hyphomicrobiaceae bacterium]|nr:CocE/NonD family hydrolase [Hyphomicrobiaceae bacterium]